MDEERNEQIKLDALFYSLKKALGYRKRGKNFVASYGTQMMLDVLGDYVIGWQEDKQRVRPALRPILGEELEYRVNAFDKKWHEN